jgi:hypothetical protein
MEDWVDRNCLLLEAGEYPDKGLNLTMQDMVRIAQESENEIPVKVQHLKESPFDSALGTVGQLYERGGQLWGRLRMPREAWEFVRLAGAKGLSVALDPERMRVDEVSFVTCPRVKAAQVFGEKGVRIFDGEELFGEGEKMTGFKEFAEGLIHTLRQAMLRTEAPEDVLKERIRLEEERKELDREKADQQIMDFKKKGLIRGTDAAARMARELLLCDENAMVIFEEKQVSVASLFKRFLEENGSVTPMGEIVRAQLDARDAADQLTAMAREKARKEGIPYVESFRRVSNENPHLAQAVREQAI